MTNTRFRQLLLLCALCLSAFSHGQEVSLEDWYQVEIIVFAQQDTYGDEGFPQNPELVYPRQLKLLSTADQLYPELPANPDLDERLAALMVPDRFLSRERAKQPQSFVPLDKNQRNLNPEAYTLDRSGNYRVLFHSAWQQKVSGSRSAPWVFVDGGKSFDGHRELEGSVRIYRSRFLNAQFNLWLSRFQSGIAGVPGEAGTSATPPLLLPEPPEPAPSKALQRLRMMDAYARLPNDTVAPFAEPAAERFRVATVDILKRSEQVGDSQLTYIDHPRMGALVLITPMENEEEKEE